MLGVITEILYCTSHSKKYYIVLNIAVLFILIKKKKKLDIDVYSLLRRMNVNNS